LDTMTARYPLCDKSVASISRGLAWMPPQDTVDIRMLFGWLASLRRADTAIVTTIVKYL